jgi:beta-xylosidase
MKRNLFFVFRFCFVVLFISGVSATNSFPQLKEEKVITDIHLADPAILHYKNTYYLYGTVEGNANEGFLVYSSPDMKRWKGPVGVNKGYALQKGDVYGTADFWAPHVFQYNNKFYIAYVANENIAIAVSDSPIGPFTQVAKTALAASVKQIDPYVFIDTNGKKYLYHVRLENGNRLFVAELNDDFSAIKDETLKECISATDTWENTANAPWPVAEGPSVLKHNNLYYFIYTANDFRNPDYAVGYATSNSPYGPWRKSIDNPIISRKNIGINGTGHGDFIGDGKGQFFYIFHTHNSENKVGPRKTAIVRSGFIRNKASGTDDLKVDEKTFYYPQLVQ